MTNTEALTDMMEFSRHGAMAQLVILQAIDSYTQALIANGLDKLKKDMGEGSMVSPEAWYGATEEIREKLDAHYEVK